MIIWVRPISFPCLVGIVFQNQFFMNVIPYKGRYGTKMLMYFRNK